MLARRAAVRHFETSKQRERLGSNVSSRERLNSDTSRGEQGSAEYPRSVSPSPARKFLCLV